MTDLYIATEDELSEAVADRLVLDANHGLRVAVRIRRQGNGYLRKKFLDLAKIAYKIPVLLLTDLDRIDCPPTLLANWRGERMLPEGMIFRVAVREIEAWLLADREGFSRFTGVQLDKVPQYPESLDDPKQTLLSLVRRYGNRDIKDGILPERGSSAKIGYAYNQTLSRFVQDAWSVTNASRNADSLDRACRRLHELSARQPHR
jgi:hypothetical protein